MKSSNLVKVSIVLSSLLIVPASQANILTSVENFFSTHKVVSESNSSEAQAPAGNQEAGNPQLDPAILYQDDGQTDDSSSALKTSFSNLDAVAQTLSAKAESLDPKIIKLGLEAYVKARSQGLDQGQILTIVDYHQPSTKPRLFVFDLKSNNLLFKELVAHGKNSGDNVPNSFSNAPSSLKSSLGVFLTQNTYIGHHGYSLRVNGLEQGINNMAASREIVVHAANYVTTAFARAHGRLGKSWGCFAVDPTVANSLINTIKGGTVIFAYYPDSNYFAHSSYVSA